MLRGPDIIQPFTSVRFGILIKIEVGEHLRYNQKAIHIFHHFPRISVCIPIKTSTTALETWVVNPNPSVLQ